MVVADQDGVIVIVNEQAVALFGYARERLLGARIEILVPAAIRERHVAHRSGYAADPHRRAMGEGMALFGRRCDGSEFPVEISLSPLELDGVDVAIAAIRDVTASRRAEEAAFHFTAVVESSRDAIIGKDLDGVIVSWNRAAERLYGYSAEEVIGRSVLLLAPPGNDDEVREILSRVRAGERVDDYETVRARRDGTLVDVSLTVSPIVDRDGEVVGASSIARDISARLRYQSQLQFLAEHDALTGLRNRRRLERDVSDQVMRARRYGEHAALLLIDLNRFKVINDTLGHRVGDQALQSVGRALSRRLRETDTLARIGGDEFAALLPYAGLQQAELVADALRQTVSQLPPIQNPPGGAFRLSVSVGIALIDEHTTDDDAVLVAADRAMYTDKAGNT
jgi:diguanylate cyclase (GGDEF)-like protein/PAS domain S-box-containing protein